MPKKRRRPEPGTRLPRLTVEVYPEEEDVIRRAKKLAIDRDETFQVVLMQALQEWVEREERGDAQA